MQNDQHIQIPQDNNESSHRLDRLAGGSQRRAPHSEKYSRFIRKARLILPLIAIGIVAIVMTWGHIQSDDLMPVIEETKAPDTLGKNELLNPKFESTDDRKQPYTIAAKRAIQGEENENLIILEEPSASILLNSGNRIEIKSKQGAFRQDNKRLLLKNDVKLFHDDGYQMETEELHIDLDKNLAWTDREVHIEGPAGTLEAHGLKANTNNETLEFIGPVNVHLNSSIAGNTLQKGFQ